MSDRTRVAPVRRPETVLESIVWFAGSNVLRQVISAATAFVRPKLLSPEHFGIWTLIRLITVYGQYLHLGSWSALRYLIPLHEARGEHDLIPRLKGTVFWGTLALYLGASVALCVVALAGDWSPEVRFGLLAASAVLIMNWLFNHYVAQLKGHQRFRPVALGTMVAAIVTFVATIGLTVEFGIYGTFLAPPLGIVASVVVLVLCRAIDKPRRFEFALFRRTAAMGGPTLAFDVLVMTVRNVDRLLVGAMLGATQLGYYGIGAMIIAYLLNLPGSSREVVEGKLFQSVGGGSGDSDTFERYFMRPLLATTWLMPALIGPAVLALPVVVPWLLPEYAPGVVPAQILAIGGYFLALTFPMRGILVARRWQGGAALLAAAAVGVNVATGVALAWLGFGTIGIALGSSAGFVFLSGGLFLFVVWRNGSRPSPRALLLLVPFPLMILALQAIQAMPLANGLSLVDLALRLLAYGGFLAVLWTLGLWSGALSRRLT